MIPESFIQELLARVDIVDVVGRYVQLRKGGANLLGLCPFHNEKSPSFTVSPSKQFYHCFGCGAHGTAISFLIEHTGASFPEAVRSLAASAGMTVPEAPRNPAQQRADQWRRTEVSRHQQALETAQAYYVRSLKASPAAVAYLRQRGLTGETARQYGLGWSGTDRRGLAQVFPHYDDNLLVEIGLVIESEDGRRYDRFRERVMFPIRNARGQIIGFGGRLIAKGEPKYLNSPETLLFSKGNELYGLWEARSAIRADGHVLVVEGYMDVVSLAQQGIGNAVATLGTATTPQHVQKLMRTSDKIVFSFDGDKAGRMAAWRALQACLPLLRDDVSLRFLFLSDGHDPDSLVREEGPEAFREAVEAAIPLSRFLLDELASHHELDEAEGRAACVHEARPLLSQIPEGVLRVQIEREFARQMRLTPEELAQMLAAPARPGLPQAPAPGQRAQAQAQAAHAPEPDTDFGAHYGEPAGESMPPWAYQESSAPEKPEGRRWNKREGRSQGGPDMNRSRRVTPMAKRLLRLLCMHPELVDELGEQQLEILEHGPHLDLVRQLIGLIGMTDARHIGGLLQAVEPDSELEAALQGLREELLAQETLPEPLAEWNDAVQRMEIESIKAEQSALIASGMPEEADRQRYQALARRLAQLTRVMAR